MDWKRCLVAVVLVLSAWSVDVRAEDSFDARLREADSVRSSDPKRFTELLTQLRADKRQTSPLQRQYLKYLQAYEAGIYRDQLAQGASLAKSLFNETRDTTLKYRAGGLVASFSAINRDFSNGLRYLEKTMALRDRVTDKSIRHDGIANGALLYSQIGQHKITLRYAEELLADSPNARMSCIAGHFQIESQLKLGMLEGKGDSAVQTVVDQCRAQREFIPANAARIVLAKKMAAEKRLPEAVALLEGALSEIEATLYPRLIAGVHAVLADLKLNLDDVAAAERHAQATVALGEQIASSSTLVSAYSTLYRIAAKREKPTLALELYKRYAEADKAHQSDVKARELAYEIVRHETLQQTQQIALLERNNQVLRLQQKLEREGAQKARLATVFLLLVLGGLVFWALQMRRHQSQLRRLAQTDTLTGIGNRHYFTQKSTRALADCARAGESAALVMFDLDHFKAINDTYGHAAGDWVLKQVGIVCSSHCRKIDFIGRIGGEEFAVLLQGLDLSAAARMAEDCRAKLAQIDTRDSGFSFIITASFGVSSTAQSGYDLSRLLSHADQMLYRAKKDGRNRVSVYTAETAEPADQKVSRRSPTLTVVNNGGA